jgi:hypothetical protein
MHPLRSLPLTVKRPITPVFPAHSHLPCRAPMCNAWTLDGEGGVVSTILHLYTTTPLHYYTTALLLCCTARTARTARTAALPHCRTASLLHSLRNA